MKIDTVEDFGVLSMGKIVVRDNNSTSLDITTDPVVSHSGEQNQVQLTNYQNFFFASRPIPQTAELHNGRQRFDSVDQASSSNAHS